MRGALYKYKEILIVEDDTYIAQLLSELLEDEGYPVTRAKYAREGLRWLNQKEFGLILLDIGLPDMSGNDFLHELNKLNAGVANTPVIVISANMNLLRPAAQVKATLNKPFDIEKLLDLVSQYNAFSTSQTG